MRFLVIAAALAVSGCATAPSAPTCTAERAVYTLRGQRGAMLRLVEPPHALNAYSDLAARVDFEGDVYWFAFVSSLGYSRDYVGRTQDPFEAARREDAGEDADDEHQAPDYDGSELHSFDAHYDVLENVPQSGAPAPAHLLATGIASSIWYSIPRRELKPAMWDLTSCADYVHR